MVSMNWLDVQYRVGNQKNKPGRPEEEMELMSIFCIYLIIPDIVRAYIMVNKPSHF